MVSDVFPVTPGALPHGTFAGTALVITCEHGGNRIPPPYRALFAPHRALLRSHRGFDAGALVMARALASEFGVPLLAATVSRLLVDLNRSVGHRQLHFDPVLELPDTRRQHILQRYYQPYRSQAERLVTEAMTARDDPAARPKPGRGPNRPIPTQSPNAVSEPRRRATGVRT